MVYVVRPDRRRRHLRATGTPQKAGMERNLLGNRYCGQTLTVPQPSPSGLGKVACLRSSVRESFGPTLGTYCSCRQ